MTLPLRHETKQSTVANIGNSVPTLKTYRTRFLVLLRITEVDQLKCIPVKDFVSMQFG